MKGIYALAVVFTSIIFTSRASAHFIWAMVGQGDKTLRMEVAESPGDSVVAMLGAMTPAIKKYGIGDLKEETDHFHIAGPLTGKPMAGGVDLLYGIHGTDLVHWSAKGAANPDSAGTNLGLPAEIMIRKAKGGLLILVLKNGKPAPKAQVEIYAPGSKEAINLETAADGTVNLPAMKNGLVAIGAIIKDPTSGEYKGGHYSDKIDMSSLTFRLG